MNVLIFGAGSQAKVDFDIIKQKGRYSVSSFFDHSNTSQDHGSVFGVPCHFYNSIDKIAETIKHTPRGIVSIGDNWIRAKVVKEIHEIVPNFEFISIVHPFSYVAPDVTIGAGTRVTAGAVVNTGSKIGEHCIINTSSSIDHDAVISDFCSIMPGAVLAGNVHVGTYSSICLGAKIIHGRKIGKHSVVGSGAVVIQDVPDYVVTVGTPSKVLKTRKPSDPYL